MKPRIGWISMPVPDITGITVRRSVPTNSNEKWLVELHTADARDETSLFLSTVALGELVRQGLSALGDEFTHETEEAADDEEAPEAEAPEASDLPRDQRQYEAPSLTCQGGICCTGLADEVAALIEREVRI